MSDDPIPNIVYGRLLEAAHISGYGFERMTDELEWLLEDDRWRQVGPGYANVLDFVGSIDLSAFDFSTKKRLQRKLKELAPDATTRAIGTATGTSHMTAHRAVTPVTPGRTPDLGKQDVDHDAVTGVTPAFDHDSSKVADLSRQAARRADAEVRREEQREANRLLVEGVCPPTGRYATVVVDPPWDWADEGDVDQHGRARPTYHTRSRDEIADQVADIIDRCCDPDVHLYLWITNRSLPKGFGLLEHWEFRYVTCLTWVKPSYGMGNYFRGQTEQVLFAVRGSLPLLRNDVGTVLTAPRGDEHSSKPDEFYDLVETCSPGPWIDAYGRRERTGWKVWGETS